ncbi:MAG TPA: response regulator transcription factor, partial [Verrucomicrobiae bacterium]|nr:response regulator transcription factor [Verrucomicrobiae bacterium]
MTKVAIVEDNATLRKYLAEVINNTPAHRCVCTCESAEEAIIQIPAHRPNVVLMDIHLPGESGIACTARLREKMPNLQVIMLTVYKDIKMIFQALKAGACGYVLKRSDDQEILSAIAEVRAGGAPMTSEIARMVVRAFADAPSIPLTEGTD